MSTAIKNQPITPQVLLPKGSKSIIAVWSGGSPGKTTIAANLAQLLAQRNNNLRIGLLDLAVISPAIHNFLGIEDNIGSLESILSSEKGSDRAELFSEYGVNRHNLLCWTGLIKNPQLLDKLDAKQTEKIISNAHGHVDILIVDLQSDTSLIPTDTALRMATQVLVVVDQNRSVIEQTARWLNNLYLRGFDTSKSYLVLNQYSELAKYTKSKIEQNLGLELIGTIPAIPKSKFDNCLVSLIQLIDIRSTRKAFDKLAAILVDSPVKESAIERLKNWGRTKRS